MVKGTVVVPRGHGFEHQHLQQGDWTYIVNWLRVYSRTNITFGLQFVKVDAFKGVGALPSTPTIFLKYLQSCTKTNLSIEEEFTENKNVSGPVDENEVEKVGVGSLRSEVGLGDVDLDKNNLFDVQIESGSSFTADSDHSVSIEPVLDPLTGSSAFPNQNRDMQEGALSGVGRRPNISGAKPRVGKRTSKAVNWEEAKIVGKLCGRSDRFNVVFSASNGAYGGLISIWDPEFFNCESNRVERNIIVLIVKLRKINYKCALINVYGQNIDGERAQLFEDLAECIRGINVPVIIGGDFNIVRTREEKLGVSFHSAAMNKFSEFIEELSLVDLPLIAGRFTWSNLRESPCWKNASRLLKNGLRWSVVKLKTEFKKQN
ncbi:hypothetical protein GQ457_08G025710 [Hibiscus cannabinus]